MFCGLRRGDKGKLTRNTRLPPAIPPMRAWELMAEEEVWDSVDANRSCGAFVRLEARTAERAAALVAVLDAIIVF